MKTTYSLVQLRPRCFRAWRDLPIFGRLLDRFVQWLHDQRYAVGTISHHVEAVPHVVRRLKRRRITSLHQLTHQHLDAIRDNSSSPKNARVGWGLSALQRFLRARKLISEGQPSPPSRVEIEIDRFAGYLREVRGLAPVTVSRHSNLIRSFLGFLRLNRNPSRIRALKHTQIEAFLGRCARTNNRFSMQHVIATLRLFLQLQHASGILTRPLHQQIDTPRVYRLEQLPRALPWDQVQALLGSIDRSNAFGQRDFTILYLAAAYGLRSGELVRLTLDDIDWRTQILRIQQTKTKQTIQLPLTDEAANVLITYLRQARPKSSHRHLFMRMRAPLIPLRAASVHDVLDHRVLCSGLKLPPFGTHVLRHSFAMRLMQQGTNLKTIGDALGHRNTESTSVYLRLNVDDLRDVALPVPATLPGHLVTLAGPDGVPRIRPARTRHNFPAHFRSRLAPSLQRFVDLKRCLGRRYIAEAAVLRHWDDFIHRHYPRASKVVPAMFTEWTKTLVTLTSTGSRQFQRIATNFLLFYARDHAGTFIPDRLTFPKPAPVVCPRLISEAEMGRVLAVAAQLPPSPANPLRAETFRLGFILLFCCGLRRGELFRLTIGDIQEEQTVLRIRLTKFHKSRLVPLSPSVTTELRRYLEKRKESKLPLASEASLMWSRRGSGEVYSAAGLVSLWHRLCVSAGVLSERGHPPRIHDLRHSCAALVLHRWYAQGVDVQAKLPHLATYLGHVSVVSTHYYLKLTPELRQAASQRFQQRFSLLLSEGGIA